MYRMLALLMVSVYAVGIPALYGTVLIKYRDLLYPLRARGRSKEDVYIAREAKLANELALRPLGILHDGCE